MSLIASELDRVLQELDVETARSLEDVVRDLLRLTRRRAAANDSGWPAGYFERTAGSFAGEPLERPPQEADELREAW